MLPSFPVSIIIPRRNRAKFTEPTYVEHVNRQIENQTATQDDNTRKAVHAITPTDATSTSQLTLGRKTEVCSFTATHLSFTLAGVNSVLTLPSRVSRPHLGVIRSR